MACSWTPCLLFFLSTSTNFWQNTCLYDTKTNRYISCIKLSISLVDYQNTAYSQHSVSTGCLVRYSMHWLMSGNCTIKTGKIATDTHDTAKKFYMVSAILHNCPLLCVWMPMATHNTLLWIEGRGFAVSTLPALASYKWNLDYLLPAFPQSMLQLELALSRTCWSFCTVAPYYNHSFPLGVASVGNNKLWWVLSILGAIAIQLTFMIELWRFLLRLVLTISLSTSQNWIFAI